MKRRFMAAALVIMAAVGFAQETEGTESYITGSKVGDILWTDLGAFGGSFAAVGLNFLALGILSSDGELSVADSIIGSAMTELSDIPLFLSGSPDALSLSIGSAALLGGQALADSGYGVSSASASTVYWGKLDLTMYKSYNAYASMRLRSAAWDNTSFKKYGALELMAAPLDIRHYAKIQPWISIALGLGVTALTASIMLPGSEDWAGWDTGRCYSGEEETTPGAFFLNTIADSALSAAYTGVGEESVYRGVLHEELKLRLGTTWAYVVDTSAFVSMHLFTDMARDMSWGSIGLHMIDVAGANLLFDWAYDEGGLPLAVTCHALWDFSAFLIQDALFCGVPLSERD